MKASNQPAMSFDGSTQWLQRTADSWGITGDPSLMVAQLLSFGSSNQDQFSFQIGTDSTGQRISAFRKGESSSHLAINFRGARETERNYTPTSNVLETELIRRTSGATITNTVVRVNTTSEAEAGNTGGSNTPSYVSTTGVVFGRNGTNTSTQYYFSGKLVAIIALLSSADQDQYALENYLEALRVA